MVNAAGIRRETGMTNIRRSRARRITGPLTVSPRPARRFHQVEQESSAQDGESQAEPEPKRVVGRSGAFRRCSPRREQLIPYTRSATRRWRKDEHDGVSSPGRVPASRGRGTGSERMSTTICPCFLGESEGAGGHYRTGKDTLSYAPPPTGGSAGATLAVAQERERQEGHAPSGPSGSSAVLRKTRSSHRGAGYLYCAARTSSSARGRRRRSVSAGKPSARPASRIRHHRLEPVPHASGRRRRVNHGGCSSSGTQSRASVTWRPRSSCSHSRLFPGACSSPPVEHPPHVRGKGSPTSPGSFTTANVTMGRFAMVAYGVYAANLKPGDLHRGNHPLTTPSQDASGSPTGGNGHGTPPRRFDDLGARTRDPEFIPSVASDLTGALVHEVVGGR